MKLSLETLISAHESRHHDHHDNDKGFSAFLPYSPVVYCLMPHEVKSQIRYASFSELDVCTNSQTDMFPYVLLHSTRSTYGVSQSLSLALFLSHSLSVSRCLCHCLSLSVSVSLSLSVCRVSLYIYICMCDIYVCIMRYTHIIYMLCMCNAAATTTGTTATTTTHYFHAIETSSCILSSAATLHTYIHAYLLICLLTYLHT